ncbi:MAG: hypothetical protein AB1505_24325 [Candidatus Latescibacterota bacterium]
MELLRLLWDGYSFTAEAPATTEVTLFHQPERHRYLLTLVDLQKDLPNLPVEGIRVHLRLPGQPIRRIVRLPDGHPVEHRDENGAVLLAIPRLHTLAMFGVELAG